MTKEELLEHHIMIGDSLDPKRMKYFCDLGYRLLYYIYGCVPILISVGNYQTGLDPDNIPRKLKTIKEEDIPKLKIIVRGNLLYHYQWISDIKDTTKLVNWLLYRYD